MQETSILQENNELFGPQGHYDHIVLISLIMAWVGSIFVLIILTCLMNKKLLMIRPKTLYFYVMSFVSLVFGANGVAAFLMLMFDFVLSKGAYIQYAREILSECVTVVIVSLPVYLIHWKCILAGMKDDQERLIWPYYKYSILGCSAVSTVFFVGILVYLLQGHMYHSWELLSIPFGYSTVGVGVWAYHWFLERKFQI